MYTVYILYAQSIDKFYVGFTGDSPELRLTKHLAAHKGFTSRAKDWQIVYKEKFDSKEQAMQREKQIKNWKSKKKILELFRSTESSTPTLGRGGFRFES